MACMITFGTSTIESFSVWRRVKPPILPPVCFRNVFPSWTAAKSTETSVSEVFQAVRRPHQRNSVDTKKYVLFHCTVHKRQHCNRPRVKNDTAAKITRFAKLWSSSRTKETIIVRVKLYWIRQCFFRSPRKHDWRWWKGEARHERQGATRHHATWPLLTPLRRLKVVVRPRR